MCVCVCVCVCARARARVCARARCQLAEEKKEPDPRGSWEPYLFIHSANIYRAPIMPHTVTKTCYNTRFLF